MKATMANRQKKASRGTDRSSQRFAAQVGRQAMSRQHAELVRGLDHELARPSAVVSRVLQLDVTGLPQRWIRAEAAAEHIVKGTVAWYAGESPLAVLRGGINAATGVQSTVEVPPIVALRGQARVNLHDCVPTLTNAKLFQRDRMVCIWCAGLFKASELTRDHIIPTSRGGANTWLNTASACKNCNSLKSSKLAEELGWEMAYLPYVPSLYEDLLLRGRNIRADVHEWLVSKLPKGSRLI